MQAIITIVGTQKVDDQTDTVELTTEGTLENTAGGWDIHYKESEATGMEGTATTVHVSKDKVILERTGSNASFLVLEKHRRHHSNYNTPYGAIDLGTYATALEYDLSSVGGQLYFAYTLGFNGSINSEHTVHITIREDNNHA